MPHDESRQIKDIRQDPNDGDETHIRKPTAKNGNGSVISGMKNGRDGAMAEKNRTRKRRDLRERPAAENLAEMFVELEPVREDSENEQEDGETEQHYCRHDAHSVPNLSRGFCYEAMARQAKRGGKRQANATKGESRKRSGNVHFPSEFSKSQESECRKT